MRGGKYEIGRHGVSGDQIESERRCHPRALAVLAAELLLCLATAGGLLALYFYVFPSAFESTPRSVYFSDDYTFNTDYRKLLLRQSARNDTGTAAAVGRALSGLFQDVKAGFILACCACIAGTTTVVIAAIGLGVGRWSYLAPRLVAQLLSFVGLCASTAIFAVFASDSRPIDRGGYGSITVFAVISALSAGGAVLEIVAMLTIFRALQQIRLRSSS